MEHLHTVLDDELRFVVNVNTREITTTGTGSTSLVQYDHNSERLTFAVPRYIEGHDMSLCNKVEVHYINIGNDKSNKSEGVYLVEDLEVSTDGEDIVVFSWLISANATKYEGTLNFLIKFTCLTGDTIDFVWNTGIFKKIYVTSGMNCGEAVVEEHLDVLEAWKQEIVAGFEVSLDAERAEAVKAVNDQMNGSLIVIRNKEEEILTTFDTKKAQVIAEIAAEKDELADEVDVLKTIVGQTLIMETQVEDTYYTRITAGEMDFIDGVPTTVDTVQGIKVLKPTSNNILSLASYIGNSVTVGGITCTADNNTLTFKGTPTESYIEFFRVDTRNLGLEIGKTYTMKQSVGFSYDDTPWVIMLSHSDFGDTSTGEPLTFTHDYPMYGDASLTLFFGGNGDADLEVDVTISFMINEGESSLPYEPYSADIGTTTFSGILSTDSYREQTDSLMLEEPVELGVFDYIDFGSQQIVRNTYYWRLTDMVSSIELQTAFGGKNFMIYPLSTLPNWNTHYSGKDALVSNLYENGSVNISDIHQAIDIGGSGVKRPWVLLRDDDLIALNDDGTINKEESIAALQAHIAESGLQVAYRTEQPTETIPIFCEKTYTAWNGGTETILPEGQTVTVTQTYIQRMGG